MNAGTPLAGRTVVVTRARTQAAELADKIEALGARIVEFPTIVIRPLESPLDPGPPDSFDWVVFTSANAVTHAARIWNERGHAHALARARVCAVGPATKRAAEAAGMIVSVVPGEFLAGRVPAALEQHGVSLAGANILFPCGNIARPELAAALRTEGAHLTEWTVYETACPPPNEAAIEALLASSPDIVTFTSGSTAGNFATLLGDERLLRLAATTIFASIGPQTSAAAWRRGIPIAIEPQRHDVPGLVEGIVEWSREKGNS